MTLPILAAVLLFFALPFINTREVNVSDHDDDDFMRPME